MLMAASSGVRIRRQSGLPDLRALEVFVAVCESPTMLQAAERLGLSQSAISQAVKSLEDELGMLLLDREVRPIRPTHAGAVLHEAAAELLAQARAVVHRVCDASRCALTHVRLGCVDSFAATVGPELIRALSGQARQIRMWSGLTPGLVEQLAARELDMVICTDVGEPDPRVTPIPLFAESWVAVFPLDFSPVDAASVQGLQAAAARAPLIRYSQRSVIGRQIELFLRHAGVQAERGFEFDTTDPLLSLVASGLGWAISTPLCLWQSRHCLGQVRVEPIVPTPLGQRHFYLLSRAGEWDGLAERVVRLSRHIVRHRIAPALRAHIPSLPPHALACPETPRADDPLSAL